MINIKRSLSTKITITAVIISLVYLTLLLVMNYYLVGKVVSQLHQDKAFTIARLLDAQIRSMDDLENSEKLLSYIQQNMWLNADFLNISIYSGKPSAPVLVATNQSLNNSQSIPEEINLVMESGKIITQKPSSVDGDIIRIFAPIHMEKKIVGSYEIDISLQAFTLNRRHLFLSLVLGFLILNAIMLSVFYIYIKERVEKPTRELLTNVNKLARGEFKARVPIQSSDELGLLSQDFNRMAYSLEQQRDELVVAKDNIEYQATHDMLTGLPNRYSFQQQLRHTLASNKRHQRQAVLLMLDLDQFKSINDRLGHQAGDALLIEVSGRLSHLMRREDMVARLGGDEFMVLVEEVSNDVNQSLVEVNTIVENILQELSKPVELVDQEVKVTASIGVAFIPPKHSNLDEIMKNVDTAMYNAKEAGGNCSRVFDVEIQEKLDKKINVLKNLKNAIESDQLRIFYQPQVDRDGKLTSAEALVRWLHPSKGMLKPKDFIAVAERNGMILELGDWVLQTVCSQLSSWRNSVARITPVPISINVSSKQFHQSHFCEKVIDALDKYQIDPSSITMELTESALLSNFSDTKMKMEKLKQKGLRFAIDDFGTGFSSLAYLKKLPMDEIKLDRSFVRDIFNDSKDANLVNAIINMSHTLDLNVVAEGVENQQQFDYLVENHCHLFQGFLFNKPLPEEQFIKYLIENTAA